MGPMMKPPPLTTLPGQASQQQPENAGGAQALADLGYTDSTQRCGNCGNYDGDMSTCNLTNGEEVDVEGSCGSYVAAAEQEPEPEAAEMQEL